MTEIGDSLRARAASYRADADRLRADIEAIKAQLLRKQGELDTCVLEEVQSVVAANIVDATGLRAEMVGGAPVVSVDPDDVQRAAPSPLSGNDPQQRMAATNAFR